MTRDERLDATIAWLWEARTHALERGDFDATVRAGRLWWTMRCRRAIERALRR